MNSSPPQGDLNRLAELFQQAGMIALDYFEAPPAELKSDATVVTISLQPAE